MNDVNFKQIAQTPILDITSKLGVTLEEKTARPPGKEPYQQWVGLCPISGKGSGTPFKVTPSLNRFVCFCPDCKMLPNKGGDIIELVSRVKKIDHRAAAQFIGGAGKPAGNDRPQQEVADVRKPSSFDPLKYLATLDARHEALNVLEMSPETLVEFQAGYSSKGLNRNRLAVALHDSHGEILAFAGVALNGEVPELLFPAKYDPPEWFNMHRVEEGQEVRIVPKILDVMHSTENGCSNVIAPLKPIDHKSLTRLLALFLEKSLTLEL